MYILNDKKSVQESMKHIFSNVPQNNIFVRVPLNALDDSIECTLRSKYEDLTHVQVKFEHDDTLRIFVDNCEYLFKEEKNEN